MKANAFLLSVVVNAADIVEIVNVGKLMNTSILAQ